MYQNILFPTHFSDSSGRDLKKALDEVARSQGTLTLLHVYEPISQIPSLTELYTVEYRDKLKEAAGKAMAAFAAKYVPQGVNLRTLTRQGVISDEIVAVAEKEGMDLIVMSAHHLERLERYFISSDAERVIRYSPCDVLVVRPQGG